MPASYIGSQIPSGVYLLTRPSRRLSTDTQTPGNQRFQSESWKYNRYCLTSEYRSRSARQVRNMISQRDTDSSHPDLQLPRMRRDEDDVQFLIQLMKTSWLNPSILEHGELFSLSSAAEAPPEVAKDLPEGMEGSIPNIEACKNTFHLFSSMRR